MVFRNLTEIIYYLRVICFSRREWLAKQPLQPEKSSVFFTAILDNDEITASREPRWNGCGCRRSGRRFTAEVQPGFNMLLLTKEDYPNGKFCSYD